MRRLNRMVAGKGEFPATMTGFNADTGAWHRRIMKKRCQDTVGLGKPRRRVVLFGVCWYAMVSHGVFPCYSLRN